MSREPKIGDSVYGVSNETNLLIELGRIADLVQVSVMQPDLPGIPHGTLLGEEVYDNGVCMGVISYVYPVTLLWTNNVRTGHKYHVDVYCEPCRRYTKYFLSEDQWNGHHWGVA